MKTSAEQMAAGARTEANFVTPVAARQNGAPVRVVRTMLTVLDRCSDCQWPEVCEGDRTCWVEERKVSREVGAYRKEERRRELGLDGLAAGIKVRLPEEPHEPAKRLLKELGAEWEVLEDGLAEGDPTAESDQPAAPASESPVSQVAVGAVEPASPSATPRKRDAKQKRWTKRKIVATILAFAEEHGRPPGVNDLGRTVYSAARREFGSWADAFEAAGLERPVHGRRIRKPAGVAQPARATAVQAGDAGSKPAPRSQPEVEATPPPTSPEPVAAAAGPSVRAALLGVLDSLRVLVEAVMPEPPE